MLETARSTATAFSATDSAFDQINADFDGQARQAAHDLSSLATSLVRVNEGLGRTQPGTAASAQLTDQRDQILTQMSALSDITSTTDELGRATVRLGDRAGPILAATDSTGSVTYQRGADGGVSFHVALQGQISDFVPGGGAMAGMLDGAERINATRGAFNQVAKSFVETVNGLQAGGQDLNGATGTAMFGLTAGTAQMSLMMTDGSKIAAARGGRVRATRTIWPRWKPCADRRASRIS